MFCCWRRYPFHWLLYGLAKRSCCRLPNHFLPITHSTVMTSVILMAWCSLVSSRWYYFWYNYINVTMQTSCSFTEFFNVFLFLSMRLLFLHGFWSDQSDTTPIRLPDWCEMCLCTQCHSWQLLRNCKYIKRGATWRVILKLAIDYMLLLLSYSCD